MNINNEHLQQYIHIYSECEQITDSRFQIEELCYFKRKHTAPERSSFMQSAELSCQAP